jgi:hypothetical protein
LAYARGDEQLANEPPSSWQRTLLTFPEVTHAKLADVLLVELGGALVIVTPMVAVLRAAGAIHQWMRLVLPWRRRTLNVCEPVARWR